MTPAEFTSDLFLAPSLIRIYLEQYLRGSSLTTLPVLLMRIDKSFDDVVGPFSPIRSTCRAQPAYTWSIDTILVSYTSRYIPLDPGMGNAYAQAARPHWGTVDPVDIIPMRTCMDGAYRSRSGTMHPRSFYLLQRST